MGFGRFVHHVGTFCLGVALVLLLVVTITAPVVHGLSMMHVHLGRNAASAQEVTFGTFGYCVRGVRTLKRHVNGHGVSRAGWGSGIWLVLVAAVLTLIGAAIVFVTCCCARNKTSERQKESSWSDGAAPAAGGRRRRYW
ncbi:hypothetical protein E4U42_006534 [Claviceps africana]|uniref:Uncharacterized protein n=1 Tax=Claviceps africana TaxID=83212 RepID=A0A8K0NGQ9_9HYPO|nr:hypothetical protein E4U42_006534 [Claviceps africana]